MEDKTPSPLKGCKLKLYPVKMNAETRTVYTDLRDARATIAELEADNEKLRDTIKSLEKFGPSVSFLPDCTARNSSPDGVYCGNSDSEHYQRPCTKQCKTPRKAGD